jgi:hypothetical protein
MRTYPAPLRPYVEQVLRYHFEAEAAGRGGYAAGAGGKSITAASCERAAMLSLRAATCPTCQGTRVQTIVSPRRVIELECLRCCGEGEIARRVEPPPEAATTRCPGCNGSGRYRKQGSFVPDRRGKRHWVANAGFLSPCRGWFRTRGGERVWEANPGYDPAHELAWCVRCRGVGWLPCGVLPMSGADHRAGYSPSEEDTTSPVGAALALMRQGGQHESVLALELAYGELGNFVRQRLGEPVELALWPLTRPGKLLMARLRLPKGKRPHKALARVRHSTEPLMASMASVAHTAAVAALELALARHYAADEAAGGQTLRLSRRIQEADGQYA